MNKKGFSLVEIIVATIVMTMMMVSVIGYIQYSGEIWQDGYSKISSTNYMRMATETIRQDLINARRVEQPMAMLGGNPTPTSMLRYSTANLPGTFTMTIDDTALIRYYSDGVTSATIHLGRNLASFTATRLSSWTLQIHIELYNDIAEEDGSFRIIASETLSFMAPGAG